MSGHDPNHQNRKVGPIDRLVNTIKRHSSQKITHVIINNSEIYDKGNLLKCGIFEIYEMRTITTKTYFMCVGKNNEIVFPILPKLKVRGLIRTSDEHFMSSENDEVRMEPSGLVTKFSIFLNTKDGKYEIKLNERDVTCIVLERIGNILSRICDYKFKIEKLEKRDEDNDDDDEITMKELDYLLVDFDNVLDGVTLDGKIDSHSDALISSDTSLVTRQPKVKANITTKRSSILLDTIWTNNDNCDISITFNMTVNKIVDNLVKHDKRSNPLYIHTNSIISDDTLV